MQAVKKQEMFASKKVLTMLTADALILSGKMARKIPIPMAMEDRLLNPHRAYVTIASSRA